MSADVGIKRNYCLLDGAYISEGARHLAVRCFFILFQMPLSGLSTMMGFLFRFGLANTVWAV